MRQDKREVGLSSREYTYTEIGKKIKKKEEKHLRDLSPSHLIISKSWRKSESKIYRSKEKIKSPGAKARCTDFI